MSIYKGDIYTKPEDVRPKPDVMKWTEADTKQVLVIAAGILLAGLVVLVIGFVLRNL